MSRIDAYLDAMDLALSGVGDFQPRPFHIVEVTPYFDDLEAIDMLARLRRLDAGGVRDREIAALFPSANAIKTLLMDMVCGMKSAGIAADERVWFTERMFDLMATAETGDIFCRDGSHRLLTPGQAEELADGATWTAAPDVARAAFRLSAGAQALVWSLYFYAWTDMGWEIHGPYEVTGPDGQPAVMIVRDYFDLAPAMLWPEIEDWPVRTARLVSLHDAAPPIRFDVLNHVWYDLPWALSSYAVELRVDGAVLDSTDAIVAAAKNLTGTAKVLQARVLHTERIPLLQRFADSRYYALRRWRTHFGDNWQPPGEVTARIKARPVRESLPVTDDLALLRLAFDPRSDVLN